MGMSASFVDATGVFWVMAKLNALGYHCAPTHRGAPHIDILVNSADGSQGVSLQVKTAWSARRYRGRRPNKVLDHLEWTMGEKCFSMNHERVWMALVDLKDGPLLELPDVYLVPSTQTHRAYLDTVKEHFGGDAEAWKWKRYHPKVDELPTPNHWDSLTRLLT